MPSIAFAAPVVPGKTDQLREAAQTHGPGGERRAAYEASSERHGITREMSWIQPTPMGDLTVVGGGLEIVIRHRLSSFASTSGSRDRLVPRLTGRPPDPAGAAGRLFAERSCLRGPTSLRAALIGNLLA